MKKVKDVYGMPHLWLPELSYGDRIHKAHMVPVTIEDLELEIRMTKSIMRYIADITSLCIAEGLVICQE